jgi:protein-L-isoaspartate(D-aspartate) O-methyltransferase
MNMPDEFHKPREKMVEMQLRRRGISDERVLSALLETPRHLFVDDNMAAKAYQDNPLPIGERQTISQPYIVACMTQALRLKGTEKVLEIGTGSGYQAAILSTLVDRVFSIERKPRLGRQAEKLLQKLGYHNVLVRIADGTYGWPEESPFDAIIVTAAAPNLQKKLISQLREGGRLVIPVGEAHLQDLLLYKKKRGEIIEENLGKCRFVKLIGKHAWESDLD